MSYCSRDITKEIVTELPKATRPEPGVVLQIRTGKIKTLVGEPSGIFKSELPGPVFIGTTGISGDEHVYHTHGGIDRAIMQYDAGHYEDWRCEKSPKPELFDFGAFGENIVGASLTEENVCIGDIYQVGDKVLFQVSEPRSPCYKLNLRFEWPRALKRVTRTGRVGWLYRVLQTGYIQSGDSINLVERPYPTWSCLNVKRVLQAKEVALPLIQDLTEIEPLTEMVREFGFIKLRKTPKRYRLIASQAVTPRVKQLTFELSEPIILRKAAFSTFTFAQIKFGNGKFERSYSIVSGDLNRFSLGVALGDNSRGGSTYLHQQLKLADEITMSPGESPRVAEDEEKCEKEGLVDRRLLIIGGIGVTAFLPLLPDWEAKGVKYEVHYAVRSLKDVAFLDLLPPEKTTVYAKDKKQRLNVNELITSPEQDGCFTNRIYCCGPSGLMDAVEHRAKETGYPDHLLHFEGFGADAAGPRGEAFDVDVKEVDSGRNENLRVPPDKSLLQVLREAGFDMASLCESGGCGACKINLCAGTVDHKGTALYDSEKSVAMLSCVSRGIGAIKIELD